LSERHAKPFVTINCAGLSHDLLESELFGHEKGAFTGAVAKKTGLLELAHEGTIFFDEIAEIEPSIQAKLLHVLEQQKFRRVGGVQEKQVDVRVIAATNRNIQGEIKRGRFREDLFYRLSVMPLTLPPLRERREDILPLVQHFVTRFSQKLNRRVQGVTPKAEVLLESYNWPGNIRELRNVIERAIILCAGDRIHASELPLDGLEQWGPAPREESEHLLSLEEVESLHIQRILAATGQNLSKAAEILGLARATLYNKMRKYNLGQL
jgi:transcriptional regulator with PAS, ATPase and Fis domain